VFGTDAVFFPVSTGTPFAGTTLPVPGGVHTALVTGLAAGTSYVVTVTPGTTGNVIVVSPGAGAATADAAGVLQVSF
jgi:hypothetical protein